MQVSTQGRKLGKTMTSWRVAVSSDPTRSWNKGTVGRHQVRHIHPNAKLVERERRKLRRGREPPRRDGRRIDHPRRRIAPKLLRRTRTPGIYLEKKGNNGKGCRCHLRNHIGERITSKKRLTKCPDLRDKKNKTEMPTTTSSHASSNSSRKRTAPTSGKKSKSKARKRGQSTSRTRVARDQSNQRINQSELAGRMRLMQSTQMTFLKRRYSTLLKLKLS